VKLSAKKMGTIKALKETLKKGGSSSATYIKNVPSEGITVRFLTEPEEWFGYFEYWDDSSKNFVPMAEGEIIPDGSRPSFRYLAVALDVETDRVVPLKLPKTAANVLILKYDKFDTMMDRNYELQKHGEGLDTTYDVTPDGPSKMNLAKYDLIDLEEVLVNARKMALGEDDLVGSGDTAPPTGPSKFDDDDVDDDEDAVEDADDDDPVAEFSEDDLFPEGEFRNDYSHAELASMTSDDIYALVEYWELDISGDSDALASIIEAQDAYADSEDDSDEDDSEADADDDDADDSDDDDSDDEVEEYTEEDLQGMSIRDLRLIALDLGIDHKGVNKTDLIDQIIESAEA